MFFIQMNKSLKSGTSCSLVPSTFSWSRNNKPISFVFFFTQFFKQSTLQMWFNKNEMLTPFGIIAFVLAIYCIWHIVEGISNFLRRCSIIVQIGEEATLEHKVHFMKSQNNFCTYIHGNWNPQWLALIQCFCWLPLSYRHLKIHFAAYLARFHLLAKCSTVLNRGWLLLICFIFDANLLRAIGEVVREFI